MAQIADYRINDLEDEIIVLEAAKASAQTYISINKYGHDVDDQVMVDDSITLEVIDFIISKYKEEIKALKEGN